MMEEDSIMLSGEREFKLQVIHRIMKKALPKHALVSTDGKRFVQEKVVAFIQSLTRQAREVACEENRTKIKGQDLVRAFQNRGLFLYRNILNSYLQVYHNRDTSSGSTETDAYDEDQNMEDMFVTMDRNVSDTVAPHDAGDKDMLFDHKVSDSVLDPFDYFEVPQTAKPTLIGTIGGQNVEPLSRMNDIDLVEKEDVSAEGANMPDFCINHIHNSKDGAAISPDMHSAAVRADPISDLFIPISVPSWTLASKSISGFAIPSIDIAALTVQVSNGVVLDGADSDILSTGSSPANSPSIEFYPFSIPAWTIPSTSVSNIRIPPVPISAINVRRSEDKDIFGTDVGGMTYPQEVRDGEEPTEQNLISGAHNGGSTPDTEGTGPTDSNTVEAEQVRTQQESNDHLVLDFDFDGFDAESLPDYKHDFLAE